MASDVGVYKRPVMDFWGCVLSAVYRNNQLLPQPDDYIYIIWTLESVSGFLP